MRTTIARSAGQSSVGGGQTSPLSPSRKVHSHKLVVDFEECEFLTATPHDDEHEEWAEEDGAYPMLPKSPPTKPPPVPDAQLTVLAGSEVLLSFTASGQ